MVHILTTPRLRLHRLDLADSLHLFATEGAEAVFRRFGVEPPEQDLFRRRFCTNVSHSERFTSILWLIYKAGDRRLMGDCGFHLVWRQHKKGELGYTLYRESDWGKGYMKEAVPPVLRSGFDELGFERVEAYTAVDNPASMALLRRHGFRREGFARKHYRIADSNTDSFAFGLLREEYEEEAPGLTAAEKLVRGFERQLLPNAAFDHRAHLTVGLWYVYHEGEWDALAKLREGLIAFLRGLGMQGHYHETKTVFWVKMLTRFVAERPRTGFDGLLSDLLQSPLADKSQPARYYSAERLASTEARASYVVPDL